MADGIRKIEIRVGSSGLIGVNVLLRADETGMFVVECPAFPGCVSQGVIEEVALDNIEETIIGWLEAENQKTEALAAMPIVQI